MTFQIQNNISLSVKIILIVFFLLLQNHPVFSKENLIEMVAENGKPIIIALEKFRSDNGEYPTDLNSLVPSYLSKLPSPAGSMSQKHRSLEKSFSYQKITNPKPEYGYYGYKLFVRKKSSFLLANIFEGEQLEGFLYYPSETYVETNARKIYSYYDGWIHKETINTLGKPIKPLLLWDRSGVYEYSK